MSETHLPELHPTDVPVPAGANPAEAPAAGDDTCPNECPIHKTRGPLLALAGWLAAALGAVLVAMVPFDPSGSLSGVWGRFLPLPALVSQHLLWCVALGASIWAIRRWFPHLLRPLGFGLILASLGAATALVWDDLQGWFAKVPGEYHQFWPKRVGYQLLTLTEVPLIQSLVAGVICIMCGRVRR